MAEQQPFRSVDYRGRQSFVRTGLVAPDRTGQIDELNTQQRADRERLNSALTAKARFEDANQRVLDQASDNALRLSQNQQLVSQELQNRSNEILQRQALANSQMQSEWNLQHQRMLKAQEIVDQQLRQQTQIQAAKAATGLGEALLGFSQTLHKQKADKINAANKRIQAAGRLRGILGNYKQPVEALEDIKDARLLNGMGLDAAARDADSRGLPNDATQLRSANGFYVDGVEEGIALKRVSELPSFLKESVDQAMLQGDLRYGTPDADKNLQLFLQQRTIDFMMESGLDNIHPDVLNQYLPEALVRAHAAIAKDFNSNNHKFTVDAQVGIARDQIRTASRSTDTFAQNLPRLLTQLVSKDPLKVSENLKATFKDLKADALDSGDLGAIDTLISVLDASDDLRPQAQDVFNDYVDFRQNYQKQRAEAANKAAKESADMLKGGFLVEAQGITDASTLSELRDKYLQQAQMLPLAQSGDLMEFLNGYTAQDLNQVKIQAEEFLANRPTPQQIKNLVRQNPAMPEGEKKKLLDTAKSIETQLKENPQYKEIIDRAQQSIVLPPLTSAMLTLNPTLKENLNRVRKQRQEELMRRFMDWVVRPGEKSSRDLQEWLKTKNQDLLDLKKNPLQESELSINYGSFDAGAEKLSPIFQQGAPKQQIGNTQNYGIFFTTPQLRQQARSGKLGTIDARSGVFLLPAEVVDLTAKFEKGIVDPLLVDLSRRANETPAGFLTQQAKRWNLPGTVQTPEPTISLSPTSGRVREGDAYSFALNSGLSHRGAIMFANAMMEESGGNTQAIHDQGTGYGLFGHRLSRRTALINHATQMGRTKSDPVAQMSYALAELNATRNNPRTAHIWATITAPNPTPAALFNAMRDWLRFADYVYPKRRQSLINALSR